MNPAQTNRRSREIVFARATTANARASKRLSAELKTLENQKQREMAKLHNAKFRIETAFSIPSLYAGSQDNVGLLQAPISSRAPSSPPASPITSPRVLRRRHSEVLTLSTRSLHLKCQALGNKSQDLNNNRLGRASSEGKLDDAYEKQSAVTAKDFNYAGVSPRSSPRPFGRLRSGTEQVSNQGISSKGQALFVKKNKAPKTPLLANRARKLSAPLMAIDENRDNLDQRIQKFHESLEAYKREKESEDEIFEDAEFTDSVPKLPDIEPNTSRTNSLPGFVPRLSFANLTLKSSLGDDDSIEKLKECRYLRIPEPSELSIDEIFIQEED